MAGEFPDLGLGLGRGHVEGERDDTDYAGRLWQFNEQEISSAFCWRPDGKSIAHVIDNSVGLTDVSSGTTLGGPAGAGPCPTRQLRRQGGLAAGFGQQRPDLDVVPGSNRVLPSRSDQKRDSTTVWLDHQATDPAQRFKMFIYHPPNPSVYTSPDGIHWSNPTSTGRLGDRITFFYNPFRNRWVYSIRTGDQSSRARLYFEHPDFLQGARWKASEPVFWTRADRLDLADPKIKDRPQLYDLNAVGYESLLLGAFTIHKGPPNGVCRAGKFPKLTELNLGFSRDGFHWSRPDREPFIPASQRDDAWDRGYLHAVGGVCLVWRDQLRFYYGGLSGRSPKHGSDMHAGGSLGVAFLRRDGFASLDAGEESGAITTRPLKFTGKHLFVNVSCPRGELRAEILDEQQQVIPAFSASNCEPVSTDSTCQQIRWKNASDLSSLAGRHLQFRFQLQRGNFYAFWVSPDASGASGGFVAGGGPGFTGLKDTVGTDALQ